MPTPEQTKKLVRGIVLAQGNHFIKELLRNHEIRIGTTKADFEKNLLRAIDDGNLQHEDVEKWLREHEGWGNQTIYPYRLKKADAKKSLWKSERAIKAALNRGKLPVSKLWNADASLEFPDQPKLTSIYFEPGVGLQFNWHQGSELWKRDTSMDFDQIIDGDHYRFLASRHIARRTVIRCEVRPTLGLAAIFVQLPENQDHKDALATVSRTVGSIVDLGNDHRYSMSDAIEGLDELVLKGRADGEGIKSKSIAFIAGRGSVSFQGHHGVPALRRVRRSVRVDEVVGERGDFTLLLSSPTRGDFNVLVGLRGDLYRCHVRSQLSRDEVWSALQVICRF